MCGVFGFVTSKPSAENMGLFKDLCYLSSTRGTDSTGIAIVHKNKIIIEKAPIPSPKFIQEKLPTYEKQLSMANVAIGHTRKWTQGKPEDNNNNHPIVSDSWVMVHNGVCSSMDRIKGYKYRGEVDSEILLSYVEQLGLEKGLPNLTGYAAVALLNKKEPNKLWLWRHNENIWLGYDDKSETLFFASTEDILETGLANKMLLFTTFQIRKMPEDTLYAVTHTPLDLEEVADVEIEVKPTRWYNKWYGQGGSVGSSYSPNRGKYVWDPTQGCLVPEFGEEDKDTKDSKVDNDRKIKCKYLNEDKTCFISFKTTRESSTPCPKDCNRYEPLKESIPTGVTNRFWFPKQSVDFSHWVREGNKKYFLSSDGFLVKIWDKDKGTHFLMRFDEAIKEEVIKANEI